MSKDLELRQLHFFGDADGCVSVRPPVPDVFHCVTNCEAEKGVVDALVSDTYTLVKLNAITRYPIKSNKPRHWLLRLKSDALPQLAGNALFCAYSKCAVFLKQHPLAIFVVIFFKRVHSEITLAMPTYLVHIFFWPISSRFLVMHIIPASWAEN